MTPTAWAQRAADPQLPLWLRVVAYAEAHAGPGGRCQLAAHELHHALDPSLTKPAISRAIATAVKVGWLHPDSSARCLVLADQATPATRHPGHQIHR